jgi:hypothetical protein
MDLGGSVGIKRHILSVDVTGGGARRSPWTRPLCEYRETDCMNAAQDGASQSFGLVSAQSGGPDPLPDDRNS